MKYKTHRDLIDLRVKWSSNTVTREDKMIELLKLILERNMGQSENR